MIAYTKVIHKVIPEIKIIINMFWLRATEAIALEQKNGRVLYLSYTDLTNFKTPSSIQTSIEYCNGWIRKSYLLVILSNPWPTFRGEE